MPIGMSKVNNCVFPRILDVNVSGGDACDNVVRYVPKISISGGDAYENVVRYVRKISISR